MYKKRFFFITFEGIEGSGKSYQSKILFNKIKKLKLPVLYTREPGGCDSAEEIRNLILSGKKNKFTKVTDTLLYLASRNEHVQKKLIPAYKKKNIVICDRFIDSTIAYQVHGKKINSSLVNIIHKNIVGKFKPDLTFILSLNLNKALSRVKKRKKKNRYDRLSKPFYLKAQNAFIKIAKKNKKRCILLNSSEDNDYVEKVIYKKFIERFIK
jgi:dTMP kinase